MASVIFPAPRYAVVSMSASSSTSALPPDRGHIRTEHRHQRSLELDALATDDFIALMADDHHAVNDAVCTAKPAISAFIDALVQRMEQGGRLVYIGAGTSGRLG